MTSTMSTWRSNQLSYNPIITPANNLSATATLTITREFEFVNRNSRLFDTANSRLFDTALVELVALQYILDSEEKKDET